MSDLATTIARLDRTINHEAMATSGIAAGRVAGLSLEPMERLVALLGDPHRSAPVIHITGTNGKGTVAAMITELLSASGLSVGTYMSPHVDRINERMSRNGEPISDEELAETLDAVMDVADLLDVAPSWFETVTAAAFRWFAEVLPEDLMKFGLIPEFIGRLPVMGVVDPLDRDALVEILMTPKNALVKQYQKFFELEDVELEFTSDALGAVADQALARGTGARGLRAILEEVLLGVMYDLPSRTDVGKVVIDADVVLENVNPTLVPRTEKPKSTRPRRAAS